VTAAARIFQHQRVWRMSREVFTAAAGMLAQAANHERGPIGAVIGIANGGVPLSVLIGDVLAVPVYEVTARHNKTDEAYLQATGEVDCDTLRLARQLDGSRLGETVLLVDDICGSGATLDTVTAAIEPHLADGARALTAVLCLNTGATARPDLWLWEVTDWVNFPWEHAPETTVPLVPLPMATGVRIR